MFCRKDLSPVINGFSYWFKCRCSCSRVSFNSAQSWKIVSLLTSYFAQYLLSSWRQVVSHCCVSLCSNCQFTNSGILRDGDCIKLIFKRLGIGRCGFITALERIGYLLGKEILIRGRNWHYVPPAFLLNPPPMLTLFLVSTINDQLRLPYSLDIYTKRLNSSY